MISQNNVHLKDAHKTPQFWLIWLVLASLARIALKRAYRTLYRSGLSLADAKRELEAQARSSAARSIPASPA